MNGSFILAHIKNQCPLQLIRKSMMMLVFRFLLINSLLVLYFVGHSQNTRELNIKPPFENIILSDKGFTDFNCEFIECDPSSFDEYYVSTIDTIKIFAGVNGPHGSGRYWNVVFGIAGQNDTLPLKGICFETSTAGWRYLQSFNTIPIPWLSDRNDDGRPEFIFWGSFMLPNYQCSLDYGLIAFVYQIDKNGSLLIDWELTSEIVGEIADEYNKPLAHADQWLMDRRKKIAELLQDFIKDKCVNDMKSDK